MSFSSQVKEELSKETNKKADSPKHCLIAQLAAMSSYCAKISDEKLIFHSENSLIINIISQIIYKAFKASESEIYIGKGCIEIKDAQLTDRILLAIKWKEHFYSHVLLKKECCKKAFLRGAFLCAGSVNNPSGSYHFEMVCHTKDEAMRLSNLWADFGIDVKTVNRKNSTVCYIKDGAGITDALNVMGAYVAQMDFYNQMILKDMRNDVNRKVNCETANLKKTVSAAMEQVKSIEYIKDKFGLDILGDKLQVVARLRLEHPELSLKDLGELLDPPLGRSGVNHRLQAIINFANEH